MKQETKRRLNKLLGRPATGDTAVLAEMVGTLLKHANQQLRGATTTTAHVQQPAAVLSAPDALHLSPMEIDDVFDFLGVTNLMTVEPEELLQGLRASLAAYAGYGMGLV